MHTSSEKPDPATAVRHSQLFSQLAQVIYAADDFGAVYQAITDAAPQLVSGCDRASLMLRSGKKHVTAAASDPVAMAVDDMERATAQGPCIDAVEEEQAVLVPDLATGSPWPELSRHVLEKTRVRGVAAFRLAVHERKAGALNIFSDRADALDETSMNDGVVLAAFASVSLLTVAERHQTSTLREGLHSNREIGKAIGMMMAFHSMGQDEAFELLRQTSQRMNIKVADMARRYVEHQQTEANARPLARAAAASAHPPPAHTR